jgi:hypothetical protein
MTKEVPRPGRFASADCSALSLWITSLERRGQVVSIPASYSEVTD